MLKVWWSGVVGAAGTQRHTRANERPQQAANSSYKNLFCRPNQQTSTLPARIQHTHSQNTDRKESKQTVQSNRFSKQPNQQNYFSSPSSTIDFASIIEPIKLNNISNESLDNYVLYHVNGIYKSRIIIL